MSTTMRYLWAALRMLVILTVALGIVYPLAVFAVGQLAFGAKANGSMLKVSGRTVGAGLIGQNFTGPTWFHPRPSAAGTGYDPLASGASNLSPSSPKLLALVASRRADIAKTDGVAPNLVPPDAVTASGSGLDPDISPEYAHIQVLRVAAARRLPRAEVEGLVHRYTKPRALGFLGEPTVNVVQLNAALASLSH